MKTFLASAFLLSLIPVLLVAQNKELHNKPGLTIKETFDLYLKSIDNRDVDALMSTVTTGKDFVFLTTGGTLIDSVEGYRKFHVDWFSEENWEMPVEVLNIHEGTDYGYVLAKFFFKATMPDGKPYENISYFTLIFHREDDMWKVIHDQITYIRPPEKKE